MTVKGGYFLVPERFTGTGEVPLTLTLLDGGQKVIGVVRDLTPPGSGTVDVPAR